MSMAIKRASALLGVTAVLIDVVACSGAEHHSVSWWQSHAEELTSKAAWCANDSARRTDVDCQNAIQALSLRALGDWKTRREAPTQFGPPAPPLPPLQPQ